MGSAKNGKIYKKEGKNHNAGGKTKKVKKTAKSPTKTTEYVNCLLGLHNLQANLLKQLKKELS